MPAKVSSRFAHRRGDHVGVEPAHAAGAADVLQPARPVGKVGPPAADRFAQRRPEILVAVEAHLLRHAHQGARLDLGGGGGLAHRRQPDLAGVLEHVAGGLARLGRELADPVGEAVENRQ